MLPAGNYIDTMSFVVAIVFLGQQLSWLTSHDVIRTVFLWLRNELDARRPLRRHVFDYSSNDGKPVGGSN